ncbi:MAG: AAA family ATPase, partial [Bacteroides sp.]
FLMRPRRFGKSLLLSMLESYYDINNAERFEELFGERYIFTHETSLRAKFLIMRFDFSMIDSYPTRLESSFEEYCRRQFLVFINKYEHLFKPGFREGVNAQKTADGCLSYINDEASFLGLNIYLIIDEYDNFTNTLLATYGTDVYRDATHGDSFYRHFFAVIKGATGGSGRALKRMFITGVSPITLDDVTSGFNIGTNISANTEFNGLLGFSETELRTMLGYYKEEGLLKAEIDSLVRIMKPWYDNYCFAEDAAGENMYNSDMVLYFVNNYIRTGLPPKQMVDSNIRTDYNKIRHLIRIDKELGGNFSIVKDIIATGQTTATINTSFPADRMVDPNNFKSLLFYFGMLSITGVSRGEPILSIPNQTVREQLYTYLIETYQQSEAFSIDLSRLDALMKAMAYDGQWEPVFTYIAEELNRQSRIRQYIEGEAHVKGFLQAYLGLSNLYMILPEYEANKGYADFYFQPKQPDIPFAYLVEVKYAKRDDSDAKLKALNKEAVTQLHQYANEASVKETLGNAQLKLIRLTFKTWELVGMEEITK